MATITNLTFRFGETWVIDFTAHDSLGAVINLTGATVRWRLAPINSVVFLLDLSIGNGITLVNGGTLGEGLITVTPAMQLAAGVIQAGDVANFYQHQCRVTLTDSSVTDQFAGSFQVLPSLF